jgi:hypothetical protein
MRTRTIACLMALGFASDIPLGCGGTEGPGDTNHTHMEGAVADCEFDVVSFRIGAGALQEVHINGLEVEALAGATKVSADVWETVQRRGVRFSRILAEGGLSATDQTPVNCVARDGFDPLRTRLNGDTRKLPWFAFLRDHAYVYVGSPGDKDPLYPEMEGKSLIADWDVASDAEVPATLGGTIGSLSMFRWRMIEKVDDRQKGVVELDPVVP